MIDKTLAYNTNTLVGGFSGGGSSRFSRRKYASQIFATNVISHDFPQNTLGEIEVNITFSEEEALDIKPRDDNPLIITGKHGSWDTKRVMIDLDNSGDVLLWNAFQKIQINSNDIKMLSISLTRLSGEQVKIIGHITLETTCGKGANANDIDVNYLIMDALSSYNIIIETPTLNTLEATVYTMYLVLKYPLMGR